MAEYLSSPSASVTPLSQNGDLTRIKGEDREEGTGRREQGPLAHCSYLYVSLASLDASSSPSTPEASASPSPSYPHTRQSHRARSFSTSIPPLLRLSQSRPSSPPPATYFPPQRRPSLSLPPSPRSSRVHRVSLPSQPLSVLRVPSHSRSGASSTPSSNPDLRPRTPTPPPTMRRRSPSRRSNRTPSPRPPLPPQPTVEPQPPPQQPQPNRNRQESQPYKLKMRGR